MKREWLVILGLILSAGILVAPAAAKASVPAHAPGQAALIQANPSTTRSAAAPARQQIRKAPLANHWYAVPRGTTCVDIYLSQSTGSGSVGYECSPHGAWCWYQRGPSCDPSSGIITGLDYTCPGYPNHKYDDWTAVADSEGAEAFMPRHCVKAAYTS
jgi:hypothetical protein